LLSGPGVEKVSSLTDDAVSQADEVDEKYLQVINVAWNPNVVLCPVLNDLNWIYRYFSVNLTKCQNCVKITHRSR